MHASGSDIQADDRWDSVLPASYELVSWSTLALLSTIGFVLLLVTFKLYVIAHNFFWQDVDVTAMENIQ